MKRYLLLPIFCLLCFGLIPSVHACQIMSQPENINISEIVPSATTILVGEVSNITYDDDWSVTVEVEVEQYLKGEGVSLIEFTVFCASYATLDTRYIFFLNPASDESYIPAFALAPDAYEPTIPATAENIAAVQAITGQSTAPQALSFTVQASRLLSKYWLWLGGTTIFLFTLGYTLFTFRRKPERKPKMKREELP